MRSYVVHACRDAGSVTLVIANLMASVGNVLASLARENDELLCCTR